MYNQIAEQQTDLDTPFYLHGQYSKHSLVSPVYRRQEYSSYKSFYKYRRL